MWGSVFCSKEKISLVYSQGCSKHMTGDESKFMSLSENKSGNVTFGNDAPWKIKGSSKNIKAI